MIKNYTPKQLLIGFLALDYIFLLLYGASMSISSWEADVIFNSESLLNTPLNLSFWIFGQNDFALRSPFITLHMINLILLYNFSKQMLKKESDALLTVFIYSILPGVNSSALVVDKAGVVIFFTLLFLNLFSKYRNIALGLLIPLFFIDQGFLLLFFALIFYAVARKDKEVLIISLIGFTINYYLFGFETHGKPQGHFIEIFGIYGAIFSPLVFLYYIYSLYWFLIKYKKPLPIIWYISFIVFILSIILSLRQTIEMEDFAAYSVIGVPLIVYSMMHSYRVRLPQHRKKTAVVFYVIMGTLFLNTALTFFNKPLYLTLDNPKKHFAYPHHFTSELADRLKAKGVYSVRADRESLQKRLKFYGIAQGGARLSEFSFHGAKEISIHIISDRAMKYYLGKN